MKDCLHEAAYEMNKPACSADGHCITCSDEALPARVVRVDEAAGMALVVIDGEQTEVDITLVDDVQPDSDPARAWRCRDRATGNGVMADRGRLGIRPAVLSVSVCRWDASADEVLAQVRHSTLEKCAEIVALRRATLAAYRDQIVAAGTAMAQAFARSATLWAFGNGGSSTDAQDLVADLLAPAFAGLGATASGRADRRCRRR